MRIFSIICCIFVCTVANEKQNKKNTYNNYGQNPNECRGRQHPRP